MLPFAVCFSLLPMASTRDSGGGSSGRNDSGGAGHLWPAQAGEVIVPGNVCTVHMSHSLIQPCAGILIIFNVSILNNILSVKNTRGVVHGRRAFSVVWHLAMLVAAPQ